MQRPVCGRALRASRAPPAAATTPSQPAAGDAMPTYEREAVAASEPPRGRRGRRPRWRAPTPTDADVGVDHCSANCSTQPALTSARCGPTSGARPRGTRTDASLRRDRRGSRARVITWSLARQRPDAPTGRRHLRRVATGGTRRSRARAPGLHRDRGAHAYRLAGRPGSSSHECRAAPVPPRRVADRPPGVGGHTTSLLLRAGRAAGGGVRAARRRGATTLTALLADHAAAASPAGRVLAVEGDARAGQLGRSSAPPPS